MSNQLIHPGYISSDGSTNGQILTSNGTYVSWQSVSAGVNSSAQYAFTNTISFSNTVTFGNATVNAAISTNSTVTSFSGTSNNSLYFGGYGLSTFVTNTYLSTSLTNVVNTTANFTYTGTQSYSNTVTFSSAVTYTANITVNGAIIAGGSNGTVGQVLTSNGTGNVYWSSPGAASVNTAAQYSFTNTISFNSILGANNVVQLNGSNGSAGQVLTSNGNSNAYWSTVSSSGTGANTYNFIAKGSFSNVWTTNTPTGFATKQGLVAYAPTGGNTGIFLSKPINTNTSYYSTDGVTWSAGPTIANAAGTTLANANILVYLPNPTLNSPAGKFVLGVGNTTLYYVNITNATTSGINWSKSSAPANVVHMAYGAGKLVAITANTTASFYNVSEDANTWSPNTGSALGTGPKYLSYFPDLAGGRFVSQVANGAAYENSMDGYIWDYLSYGAGNITLGTNTFFRAGTLNSPISYNSNSIGVATYFAVSNNWIASSTNFISWNIVNAAATLGISNTQWYSVGSYGGYSLFTSGSTGVIYGITNNASTITTIYAAPGINAISGPGFISTPLNYTIFDNSTTGNNISTFSYGTTVINPQQRGYMDNIIIGESIPTKGRFNELLATELTIAYHSPNNAVGGYDLMTMAGGYLTIQSGGSGSTTVMSQGSFYIGVPGGANVAMHGDGFFAGSATVNSYLYSSGLYFNQNNVNGTNGLFSVAQVYMNPVGGSNSSGTGGFWLRPDTGLFLGNTAASFQIALSANTGAYLYLGSYTQSTTGTGGAIVNTSMHFIGNNTINAYMSTNYAAGNLALVMQNTTTNAYLTPNTLFIGNDSINTTVNTVSIYINPTSGANTTGTGGLSISPINGIFFGNNTINATQNTGYLILNPTASANTTGSGGAWIGGQQAAMFLGNTATYVSLSPTTFTMGQTGGGASIFYTGISPSNTTGSGALQFNSTGGGPVLFAGNNTSNLYWNGTYSSEGSTLFVGTATGTGTGGGKVNTSTFFAGNNTVNAIISYNTSLGIQINPTAAANTTGSGGFITNGSAMFIGNNAANISFNVATAASPTINVGTGGTIGIAGSTTGTGGFVANSTTMLIGNTSINAVHNTSAITINPTALANTTGTGGLYATGTSLFIGNNTSNTLINAGGIFIGGVPLSISINTAVAYTWSNVNIFSNTNPSTNNNSGSVIIYGGVGVNGNIYTSGRVGYASANVSAAYTFYNANTGTLDTVFG